MAGTVPVDAAALRAAVADDRYWQTSHPENAAWRSWVTDGYQAVYGKQREQGGVVHVRAYTRNRDGHTEHVRAHTRSDPPGGEEDQGMAAPMTFGMRRNLRSDPNITRRGEWCTRVFSPDHRRPLASRHYPKRSLWTDAAT